MAPTRPAYAVFRAIAFTLISVAPAAAEYRKESPVALVIEAAGARYLPAGSRTPLAVQAGVFLFSGDTLSGAGGAARILWCPEGASKKFEYTVQGNVTLALDRTAPPTGGKELDLCLLPALERNPEVATLPSLSAIVPAPLPMSKVQLDIADTPPETAAALQTMSRRDLTEPRIRLAFAVSLIAAGLSDEAIDQYAELAKLWPDQPRFGRLILDLRQSGSTREIVHPQPGLPTPMPNVPAAKGKTYALVIGIKKYEQDRVPDLLFADADANEFARFITSDRGGKAEIVTLINEQARSSEIRNRMTDLLAKLRKDDTFVFYVAAHGDMQGDMPIIVTYRGNPQDPNINGLPLSEIQKLRFGEKQGFHQVRVFLDICHAGNIALLEAVAPKGRPGVPRPPPAEFFCLTATHQGPDALAYEDPKFGHGVFTYFLLRGLDTDEAREAPGDHIITAGGLSRFVENWVEKATTSDKDGKPRQKPTSLLGVGLGEEIADLNLKGPDYTDTRPLASMVIPADRLGKLRRQIPGRKLVTVPASPPANLDRRIALEDEGESILLRYLEGDEVPQERADFARGAVVFAEALALQPGSPYLAAREVFCEGRVAVFDKRYDDAIRALERSIRLDPVAAYAYNGLGIAYLEKGEYNTARVAFEDAIQRAPKWAYPRHNLALVHTQAGNYEEAIATYLAASIRAPDYSYLPYNLGLLYQKMNRLDDAEEAYRLAARNAERNPPGRSEPYIALGVLKAFEGKWKDAEAFYRKALDIPAAELSRRTARHNLAALLARRNAGWAEAERLWRENGAYVPSELALAQAYAARGQTGGAIAEYRKVLGEMPDHLSARMQLAAELEERGDLDAAVSELRTALSQQPENPVPLERLAASLAVANHRAEALDLYKSAIARAPDSATRSRLAKAAKRLENAR